MAVMKPTNMPVWGVYGRTTPKTPWWLMGIIDRREHAEAFAKSRRGTEGHPGTAWHAMPYVGVASFVGWASVPDHLDAGASDVKEIPSSG